MTYRRATFDPFQTIHTQSHGSRYWGCFVCLTSLNEVVKEVINHLIDEESEELWEKVGMHAPVDKANCAPVVSEIFAKGQFSSQRQSFSQVCVHMKWIVWVEFQWANSSNTLHYDKWLHLFVRRRNNILNDHSNNFHLQQLILLLQGDNFINKIAAQQSLRSQVMCMQPYLKSTNRYYILRASVNVYWSRTRQKRIVQRA